MPQDVLGKEYKILSDKKLFLFDMDGTIYLGGILFDRVKELLKSIEDKGAKYVFITNNSSKSVKDYVKKLSSFGIKTTEENFFTSSQASAILLKEKFKDKLIFVQGTKSFVKGLKKMGLNLTTRYSDKAVCVLVGFDRELNFKKMETTCKMLKKDIPYYATNPDYNCPTEFGSVPDCGSMCFGYEKATGKSPIYIGKPKPIMIEIVSEKFKVNKEQVVVIGDRIYTDIASGYNAGVDTVLVLSGEATMEDYNREEIKPTFVLDSVAELLKILK